MRKTKILIVINITLLVFLLGLNLRPNNVNAQSNGDSLTIPTNFTLLELGENTGNTENVSTIDIVIPTSSWNLNEVQLNFSNIKLGQEIKTIEDDSFGVYTIYRQNPSFRVHGYGIQINLTEPTILYGVELYGSKGLLTTESIQIQIRGYDYVNNKPNNTIYTSTTLNMSSVSGWHKQLFTDSISLAEGSYYLVLNGSNIIDINTKYYWAYNNIDPSDPDLHLSELIDDWSNGVKNTTLLYKLIQQVDRSFFPQEINMSVNINGDSYSVKDGASLGSGNILITNLNHNLDGPNLNIPIIINKSIELDFNLNYSIRMSKNLECESSVMIDENYYNSWSVTPQLFREFSNYSVKFFFPENWFDLSVKRDSVDMQSQIQIDSIDHFIFIPNNTILDGVDWLITANSTRKSFDLDVDRTEFIAGQELKFFISEPLLNGNYTFILNDPFHDKIYTSNNSIYSPSDSNSFTYIVPSSALDGDYKAFVYWFNGTDAGVVTQVFTVILPVVFDWTLVIGIVVIAGLGSAVTASSIILVKKNKRKKLAIKQKTINKFMDILNLNYVIVIEKNSSLNVYDQAFTGKKFNSTLISGFLEAIRTFGFDISGSDERSQTVKLEYQKSKILMSDFKHFRLIFIMKDLPSSQFYGVIDDLSLEIEEKYGMYLEKFKGNLQPFDGIENLLRKHLGTAFLYPLKLTGIGNIKITPTEKSLINKAIVIMKKTRLESFYVTQLIGEKSFDSKEIEALYSLIIKRIFNPHS
ncbi:MAG: hypothetical protein KGD72_03805 [Candidatus Lokiarchaeota archaeon]|nr:hypothetical protein [Candidatus Lokiarchaeota archaeon]